MVHCVSGRGGPGQVVLVAGQSGGLVELVEHLLRERHVVPHRAAHAAHHLVLGLLVGRGAAPPVSYLKRYNFVSNVARIWQPCSVG